MKLTNHRMLVSEKTGISFPRLECWNGEAKVATVAAQFNNQRVLCRISQKTLIDKFGASVENPMLSVDQNRIVIQEAARMLLENGIFEEDGSVLILAHHF